MPSPLLDAEAPTFTECPDDMEVDITDSQDQVVTVDWDAPVAVDNDEDTVEVELQV